MNINFNTKTKTITLLEPITLKELMSLKTYFHDIEDWTITGKIVEIQNAVEKVKADHQDKWKEIISDSIKAEQEKIEKSKRPIWVNRRPKTPLDVYYNDLSAKELVFDEALNKYTTQYSYPLIITPNTEM